MLNKLNNRLKVSVRSLRSNKGLSLVELIVAVAILGFLSGIVIHAFTTSSTVFRKSRKIGDATDTAQNIQEVIEALSVKEFLTDPSEKDGEGNVISPGNVKNMLGYTEKQHDSDNLSSYLVDESKGVYSEKYSGIKFGRNAFDAKITFSPGEGERYDDNTIDLTQSDGFYQINNKKLANYQKPDGVYSQDFSPTNNPDYLADQWVESYLFAKEGTIKKDRQIVIDIDGERDEDNVMQPYVTVNYQYWFTYEDRGTHKTVYSNYDLYPDNPDLKDYEVSIDFPVQSENEDLYVVYISYFPLYADNYTFTHRSNYGEKYVDHFQINNPKDIPVQVVLVKQFPVITDLETGEVTLLDKSSIDLSTLESQYRIIVNEYHSKDYIVNANELMKEEKYRSLFLTNATINLTTQQPMQNALYHICALISRIKTDETGNPELDESGDVQYIDRFTVKKMGGEFIKEGSLLNNESVARLYDVTIELYEEGSDDVYATFRYSKSTDK